MERKLGGEPHPLGGGEEIDDPASGFVYPRVPKVSAGILAYDKKVDPIYLVDQPMKSGEQGLRRVSSPFTVETHSPHRYLTIDEALGVDTRSTDRAREDVESRIVHALQQDGIRLGNGERLVLTNVVTADDHRVVTHRARGPKARTPDTCIAVFGPDETVNRFSERRALTRGNAIRND